METDFLVKQSIITVSYFYPHLVNMQRFKKNLSHDAFSSGSGRGFRTQSEKGAYGQITADGDRAQLIRENPIKGWKQTCRRNLNVLLIVNENIVAIAKNLGRKNKDYFKC